MKNILVFWFVLFEFTSVYSQNNISDSAAYYNKIFMVAQQQPVFTGGASKWISDHTVYPKQASDSNIQGTVYLSLIIEKDGSVSSITVLKGVKGGSSLDSEAVRVVSAMPKWTPGIENGHAVIVQMMLPVNFKLVDNIDIIRGYSSVQVKPVFPGDINKWIIDHTDYPKMALTANEQDTVDIAFIVEIDGSVSHVQVARGQHKYLNAEAVKVVSNMPKWTPALQNGQPVRVLCMVPIRFALNYNNVSYMGKHLNPIDTIYTADSARIIREQPQFPGFINKWISSHITYPENAKKDNVQGSVYVSFMVEKDGSITNIKALYGVNAYLTAEAIRVVSSMPKWIPGKENGQPARVQYTLPINFTLE